MQCALRLDRARRQRVDPDVLRRVVDRHDLGELDQRALGRAIGGAPGAADAAELRGDKDDRAAAARRSCSGSTARLSRNEPVRLMSSTRRQSASVVSMHRAARVVRRGAADQDVEPAERGMRRVGRGERLRPRSATSQTLRHRPAADLGDQPGRLRARPRDRCRSRRPPRPPRQRRPRSRGRCRRRRR